MQQWRKSAPPILSTSHCDFNGTRLCAHARKTILFFIPIHLFTTQMVPSSYPQLFPSSLFLFGHYKGLPSMNNIIIFFLFVSLFHFHRTLFSWACGSLHEPQKLFVHSLVCPITHSSLDRFQPNLVQHFPHVCSICHTVFSLKNTLVKKGYYTAG